MYTTRIHPVQSCSADGLHVVGLLALIWLGVVCAIFFVVLIVVGTITAHKLEQAPSPDSKRVSWNPRYTSSEKEASLV